MIVQLRLLLNYYDDYRYSKRSDRRSNLYHRTIASTTTVITTAFRRSRLSLIIFLSMMVLLMMTKQFDQFVYSRNGSRIVTVTAAAAAFVPSVIRISTTPEISDIQSPNRRRRYSSLYASNYNIRKTRKIENVSSSPTVVTELEKKYLSTSSNAAYETNLHQQGQRKAPPPMPLLGGGGYNRPVVQWYPGHIAKAERALANTMKAVDVVVEVRDARIPSATSHPSVSGGTNNPQQQWCQNKPRIIVLTHMDAIPRIALQSWHRALLHDNTIDNNNKTPSGNYTKSSITTATTKTTLLSPNQLIQNQAAQVETVRVQYNPTSSSSSSSAAAVSPTSEAKAVAKRRKLKRSVTLGMSSSFSSSSLQQPPTPAKAVIYVNAKLGVGIHGLTRAIMMAGQHIQDRRTKRGLCNRPLRVGVLGYPNVGKSALINKLIGRRRCPTANLPGVTRSLQWIRVKHDTATSNSKRTQEFELLDSPGIIPAVLADQSDAMLLAACHCIGEASYDNQAVAAYLCEWILAVHALQYHKQVAPHWRNKVLERYKFDPITKSKPKQLYPHEEAELEEQQIESGINRLTGEDMLYIVADNTCQGDPEDAARKILQDFRSGRMGPICLQVAPVVVASTDSTEEKEENRAKDIVAVDNNNVNQQQQRQEQMNYIRDTMNDPDDIVWQIQKQQRRLEQDRRAIMALETVRSRGIVLPQSIAIAAAADVTATTATAADVDPTASATAGQAQQQLSNNAAPVTPTSMIGKGLFEGW